MEVMLYLHETPPGDSIIAAADDAATKPA